MVTLAIKSDELSEKEQHWLFRNWLHNAGIVRDNVTFDESNNVPLLLLGPDAIKATLGLKGISDWHGHITHKDGKLVGCTFAPKAVIGNPNLLPVVIRETTNLMEAAQNPDVINWRPTVEKGRCYAPGDNARVIDLEWNPGDRSLICVGMSDSASRAATTFDCDRAVRVIKAHRGRIVGHNVIDADFPVMGYKPASFGERHVFDTKIVAHIIHPHLAELGLYGLGDLVRYYIPCSDWKQDKADLAQYNGYDCAYTFRLYDMLCADLDATDQWHLVEKQQRLAEMTRLMHNKGVKVDTDAIRNFDQEWAAKRAALKETFPFNPNSPKQVMAWAKENGITLRNTRFETIDRAAGKHDTLAKLRDYKDEGKSISTWYNEEAQETGWIWPQFNVTGTEVARFSSSGPNVQNIPKYLRHIIVPRDPSLELVSWDYSSIETRMVAFYANDRAILDAPAGTDLYRLTAAMIYGKRYSEVTDEERKSTKVTELASLYGETPHNLAKRMFGSTKREHVAHAAKLQDAYFAAHPAIRNWQRSIAEQLDKGDLILRNAFNRMRIVYAQNSHERKKRGCHFLGCSTAADIVNGKALQVWEETGLVPLLVVHDELCYELPKGYDGERITRCIGEILAEPIRELNGLTVPTKRKTGANYGFTA